MERKEIVKQISRVLHRLLPGVPIFLYGSEARGEATPDSDFDVLVILDDSKEGKEFAQNKIKVSEIQSEIYPSSHVGVKSMLGLHFVRTGKISVELG